MRSKKRILCMLLAVVLLLSMEHGVFAADICIVAGSTNLCGSNWDQTDSSNAMTQKGGVYEKVYKNVAAGDYQFRIVHNGNWMGVNGSNVLFSVFTPCDVTITYNPADGAITYTGANVGKTTFKVNAIYAVGAANASAPGWLHGENWNQAAESNKMTEIDTGVYGIVYANLPAGKYEFKFAADGAWDHSWGGSFTEFDADADILYNGGNITFELTETKDVTLFMDLSNFSLHTGGAKYKIALSAPGTAVLPIPGDDNTSNDNTNVPGSSVGGAVDPIAGKIVNDAYALAPGTALSYDATLTGKIIKVDTPFDPTYNNITVTIEVSGYADKPIMCFRLKGEGADKLAIGDTITVTGKIKNYNGTIEYDTGCSLDKVVKGNNQAVVAPTDPKKIVDAAFALGKGESLPYWATLTGRITEIASEYDAAYKNITVIIEVAGSNGNKTIECYRLKGEGAENLKVGDIITVTGQLTRYYKAATEDKEEVDKIEFNAGCTFVKSAPPTPTASKKIVDAAFALGKGESLPYMATLTGMIISVDTLYDASYKNITVTIEVEGSNGKKSIVCYRLKGEGAKNLQTGDMITVTGQLTRYYREATEDLPSIDRVEFVYPTLVANMGSVCKHSYQLTVIPAICTKGSYEAQVCVLCGYIDPDSVSEETSAPLPHSYVTKVISPTCTQEGYAVHTCSLCGTSYTGGKAPALGHSFSGFVADKNATCTADGTKTSTCRLCGLTETVADEGSALGHSFTHYLYGYNALCQQDGTETAKCDRCDKTDTVTLLGSALGHSYTDGTCHRCGKEEPNRLLGDITGDNKLNIGDVARLYALIRSSDLVVDEALLAYADITGDGKLNIGDAGRLYAHIKGTNPIA